MLILLLFVLIFNFSTLNSSNFQWLSGGSFNDVRVINERDIWFAGELIVHGYKDTDNKWYFQQKGNEVTENNFINKIDFYKAKYGIALANNYIFYTSDNGSSWNKYKLPDNYTFYDIKIVDEKTAYACGKENIHYGQGIIAKTENGGKTWQIVFKTDIYYGGSFYEIIMWDKKRGAAVGTFYDGWGSFGAIFKTDNSWQDSNKIITKNIELFGISSKSPDYIAFFGGKITSSPYIGIWKNNNEFSAIIDNDIKVIKDIYFDNATHGFAVGHYENKSLYERGGVFLETFDSGKTWKRINFPDYSSLNQPFDGYLNNLETINFIAVAGNDYFIGQGYSTFFPCADRVCTGKVLFSRDKVKWEVVSKLSGFKYVKSYLFEQNNGRLKGYIAGYDGNIINSFFRKIEDSTLHSPHFFEYLCNIYDLYMADVNNGWLAYCRDENYKKFYLLNTEDAGNSWIKKEIKNFNENYIKDIKITASNSGDLILGIKSSSENYILKNLFSNPEKITVYNFYSLNYLNGKKICLIENFVPVCINNQNSKEFFENIGEDKYAQFSYLKFLDDNNGYAIRKFDKAIFKTIDGGKSWTFKGRLPVDRDDVKVNFFDSNHGYLIYTNKIYYSNDSGLTWTQLTDGVNPTSLSSLSFSKNYGAIAFTPSGMLIEKKKGEINYIKNYCAKFSEISNTIYIPCIKIGNTGFNALFELSEISPDITIRLKNISQVSYFNDTKNTCTTFNSNTRILHIPCLESGNDTYQLDFAIRKIQPYVELLLTNIQKK